MNNQLKGTLIISLSAIFFGSYGVWARLIGSQFDNFFQAYVRSLLILLILVPLAFATRNIKKVERKDWKWILLYTLSGSLTIAPIFYAFNIIGIGSTTLLFYASYTIISFILGFIYFQEKMPLEKIIALILSMIGLFLIFNLSLQQNFLLAALCAIVSGTAGGIEITFTKKVSSKYSAMQLSIYTWAVILIFHLIGSLILNERQLLPALSIPWFGILGYAVASFGAFILVLIGYRYVEPAVGALVGLLEIVIGIIFGILLFSETLTPQIIIGGLLIFIAGALPNIRLLFNYHENNKNNSRHK